MALRRPVEPAQYLSIRYTERLAEAGIQGSVRSVGDSYDNALAEVIHPNGPWRNLDKGEFATLAWVDWFNERRLLEPIGNIPPAEFEAMYLQQQDETTTGVGHKSPSLRQTRGGSSRRTPGSFPGALGSFRSRASLRPSKSQTRISSYTSPRPGGSSALSRGAADG